MKTTLIVAFAVLLFASVARADEVTTDLGVLYIPDGSVVTSIGEVTFDGVECPVVSFSFADGTGMAEEQGPMGAIGSINFTTPVSGLSFYLYGPYQSATDNLGDAYFMPDSFEGTVAFAGPGITSIDWEIGDNTGLAGIESMNYTLDGTDPPNVPEPSSLLLSGIGVAALIGLTSRNRAGTRQS
jgi:hypothetical protein